MGKRVDEEYSEFQDNVTMTQDELEAWRESDNRKVYAQRKSAGENIDVPLNDVQRLKSTPKSEWEDKDDGFNEVEQAQQVNNFISRMRAVDQGDPMPGTDPELSKRDASLLNWGFDPNPNEKDFEGDLL